MDMFDFSEDEIQEQLEILGYTNIPKHRLRHFKQGRCERWCNSPTSPALAILIKLIMETSKSVQNILSVSLH